MQNWGVRCAIGGLSTNQITGLRTASRCLEKNCMGKKDGFAHSLGFLYGREKNKDM